LLFASAIFTHPAPVVIVNVTPPVGVMIFPFADITTRSLTTLHQFPQYVTAAGGPIPSETASNVKFTLVHAESSIYPESFLYWIFLLFQNDHFCHDLLSYESHP